MDYFDEEADWLQSWLVNDALTSKPAIASQTPL